MAALMAISAVSRSRISPTIIISGSWRRKALRAAAKVIPTFSLTGTWLIPLKLNSTGSSAVSILTSSLFSLLRTEYSVVVLPLPVGPVTRSRPYGMEMQRLRVSKVFGSNPNLVRSTLRALWSRIRKTMPSPKRVGNVETRKSTAFFFPKRILILPSCGIRRSVIFNPAKIFILESRAFFMLTGRFIDL